MKIAYNHNNELICPHCGAEHSYLHHDQVTVYSRDEDSPRLTGGVNETGESDRRLDTD